MVRLCKNLHLALKKSYQRRQRQLSENAFPRQKRRRTLDHPRALSRSNGGFKEGWKDAQQSAHVNLRRNISR